MLAYLAYLLASQLAPRVPRPVGYRVCDLLGAMAWRAAPGARKIVTANLRQVLTAAPSSDLVRSVFQHTARNYFDTFVIPSLPATELRHWARVTGTEHVDEALQGGCGAILAGAHLSSPALAAQLLAIHGYPMTVIVEPLQPPRLHDLINQHRGAHGVRLIPLSGSATTREIIRELRSNRVVGLMMDRDVAGTGEPIPFFGAPARLPLGPAVLSLATGAPILPAPVIREDDGIVHGIIEAGITVDRTGDRAADARALTRPVLERFEYYIRRVPGQWTVLRPVWTEPSPSLAASRLQTT